MILNKRFEQSEKAGVRIANGYIAFRKVRMNVHCFVVDGVLIDTGGFSLRKEFMEFLDAKDIEQVLLTHHHEDHTGNAAYMQKKGIPLYMGEETILSCMEKAHYPLYRKLFWGKRPPLCAEPLSKTLKSKNAIWDVINTPGHSIDHKSFLNRETGQLFTGDLYCLERTRVILRDESIPTIIKSLERVLTYDFQEVICNHAGYLNNGRQKLYRKLEFLWEFQEQVKKLHAEGKSTSEIDRLLNPKKYPISRFSLGEWDSIHMVTSVLEERVE